MLQRSPTYIVSLPAEDAIANFLRRRLPAMLAYQLVRWKNVLLMAAHFQLSRRRPELVKRMIRKGIERNLPPGFAFDTHFTPPYNPWEQRLCLVPDGDLFQAISDGRASIATGTIETFTERGIRLTSGEQLEAEMIVTATGLNMQLLGGIELRVDGGEVKPADTFSYKGMMLSGVPNMAIAFGYTNASWTLKCDLTCAYVCRLLNHMDAHGYAQCVAQVADPAMASEPFIDFSSGYVQRSIHLFPRQGERPPWRLYQNYALDVLSLRLRALEDGTLRFSRAPAATGASAPAQEIAA
jgi:cation diffusion facilitator CzcD-associated flavoprotein CzcO